MIGRKNIWAHLAIALVLVLVAAFAGQVHRWQKQWKTAPPSQSAQRGTDEDSDDESTGSDDSAQHAEVIVRFRLGTTRDAIEKITAQLNDEIEDRIESVDGLDIIEDKNGKDAASVVAQYQALP